MTNIYKLLDTMLSMLERAPSVPVLGVKMIPTRDLQNLIEKAVSELPAEIAKSREILNYKDQIILNAQKKAEEIIMQAQHDASSIVSSAQNHATHILSQSELIKAVNYEAEKLRQQVQMETQQIYQLTEKEIYEAEIKASQQIQMTLNQAYQEAENIKENAYNYAGFILDQMEKLTTGALQIINSGQKQLTDHVTRNKSQPYQKFQHALAQVNNLPKDPEHYLESMTQQPQMQQERN